MWRTWASTVRSLTTSRLARPLWLTGAPATLGADSVSAAWPTARLDPIGRLRVLKASLPGVAMRERVIDAPFEDVWEFVSDLETSVPEFERDVARLRVVWAAGEQLRVHSWSPGVPVPLGFDVTLQPGWMVSTPRPTSWAWRPCRTATAPDSGTWRGSRWVGRWRG